MKRIVYVLLVLSFVSCQGQNSTTEKAKEPVKEITNKEVKKDTMKSALKDGLPEQTPKKDEAIPYLTNGKIKSTNMKFEVVKTEAEWKAQLSPEEYAVLREKGTERPFTGEYYKHFEKGMYVCAACENPLFTSDTKFDSHCGWPSFDEAIKGSTIYHKDTSYGMIRTEVMCAKCGGHLGHVFDDGPKATTGMRYCTNSVSIKFIPEK